MKRIFTILTLFSGIYAIQAQTEIKSLIVETPGKSIKQYSKENLTVTPGNAGLDQVWDFSDVTFSDKDLIVSEYVNPSSTPNGSSFPDANLAEKYGSEIYYYKFTATEKVLAGGILSENGKETIYTFSDPETYAKAPMFYGDTVVDYYTVRSGSIEQNGFYTAIYDGFGTLKTSKGTYSDVIRLNENHVNLTEEVYIGSYSYYIPGNTIPLFSITETNYQKINYKVKTVILYETSVVTLGQQSYTRELDLSVNPNPAENFLSVDFRNLPSGEYTLRLTEQNGSAIIEKTIHPSEGEAHSLNIADLKSGLYFLEVVSDQGRTVNKIVKK